MLQTSKGYKMQSSEIQVGIQREKKISIFPNSLLWILKLIFNARTGRQRKIFPNSFKKTKTFKSNNALTRFPLFGNEEEIFWLGLKEGKSHASSKATVEGSSKSATRWFFEEQLSVANEMCGNSWRIYKSRRQHTRRHLLHFGEEEKMLPRSTTTTDCCLSNFQMQTPY